MRVSQIQTTQWLVVVIMGLMLAAPANAADKAKPWRPWNGQIPKAPEHVKVKKGDTLSGYAGRYLWPLIWIVNQESVDNPHLIYPGQQIKIPPNDGMVGYGRGGGTYGPPIGSVLFSTPGEVRYFRSDGDEIALIAGDPIYGSGTIESESGGALIRLDDGTMLRIFDRTQVLVNDAVKDKEKKSSYRLMDQKQGRVLYALPKYPDPSFRVEVKTAVATIDPQSRRFQVDAVPGSDTRISAFDGKLRVIGRSRFVDVPNSHGVAISPDGKRMTEVRLPDAPAMQAPSGVTGNTVNFAWRPSAQADRYTLHIGSDRELIDLVFIGTIYDDTKFEMDIRNAGDYFWIVEAVNELGFNSAPQVPLRFTVSNQFVGLGSQ